ncbi:MAG: sortase [Roseiflexaceae bacterium]
MLWTCGNLLMLIGLVVLLYVGGIYANEEYGRYAARGDTDVPAQPAVMETESSEPAPFIAPLLNSGGSTEGPVSSPIPSADQIANPPTVTRIMIPSIGVDSKVVEVGWEEVVQKGQKVAVWQVAKYAVGQHIGSANPGDGGNVVLAGHVGGYGKVFKDLFYVKPGDQITLYSNGQQYLYVVRDHLVVTEEGVSPEQQAENAKLISPTDEELVTLITCWPASGPKRYSERIIVRAVPFAAAYTQTRSSESSWSIR